jgi:hypothetical protein
VECPATRLSLDMPTELEILEKTHNPNDKSRRLGFWRRSRWNFVTTEDMRSFRTGNDSTANGFRFGVSNANSTSITAPANNSNVNPDPASETVPISNSNSDMDTDFDTEFPAIGSTSTPALEVVEETPLIVPDKGKKRPRSSLGRGIGDDLVDSSSIQESEEEEEIWDTVNGRGSGSQDTYGAQSAISLLSQSTSLGITTSNKYDVLGMEGAEDDSDVEMAQGDPQEGVTSQPNQALVAPPLDSNESPRATNTFS